MSDDEIIEVIQEFAVVIRRQWMQMMGLSAEEIDQHCGSGFPIDAREELRELVAMCDIKKAESCQ